jgi:glutamate dehydrogenase/leucine dehydrogenase
MFAFADKLGPEKIVHLSRAGAGLKAIVTVDNTACGPAIGGIRMAPDVGAEEAFRLARAMTLKNAAAGLAHGGGKAVIFGDPRMPLAEKERVIRAFARAIADITDYIPGPDMGTNEQCMAWIKDEIGRAVGLPRVLGGIPLDEIGATGLGLATAVAAAKDHIGFDIKGARVAIQGFGAVGKHAARFLAQRGTILVAASDTHGTLADPDGLDVSALISLKDRGGKLTDHPKGRKLDPDAIIDAECDIWIPAARPDVVRADNVGRLRTRLVAQGANIPFTLEAERYLHERKVLVLPDFIANAGGVICAAVEFHGGSEAGALSTIAEKIDGNVREVLAAAKRAGTMPRQAALAIAQGRVAAAMEFRRWR